MWLVTSIWLWKCIFSNKFRHLTRIVTPLVSCRFTRDLSCLFDYVILLVDLKILKTYISFMKFRYLIKTVTPLVLSLHQWLVISHATCHANLTMKFKHLIRIVTSAMTFLLTSVLSCQFDYRNLHYDYKILVFNKNCLFISDLSFTWVFLCQLDKENVHFDY